MVNSQKYYGFVKDVIFNLDWKEIKQKIILIVLEI